MSRPALLAIVLAFLWAPFALAAGVKESAGVVREEPVGHGTSPGAGSPDHSPIPESVGRSAIKEDTHPPPLRGAKETKNTPPATVRARDGGYSTLGDYYKGIPQLLKEQGGVAEALVGFMGAASQLASIARSNAAQYSGMTNKLAESQGSLGSLNGMRPANVSGVSGAARSPPSLPDPVPENPNSTVDQSQAAAKVSADSPVLHYIRPSRLSKTAPSDNRFFSPTSGSQISKSSSVRDTASAGLADSQGAENSCRDGKCDFDAHTTSGQSGIGNATFGGGLPGAPPPRGAGESGSQAFELMVSGAKTPEMESVMSAFGDKQGGEAARIPASVLSQDLDPQSLFSRISRAHVRAQMRGNLAHTAENR